MTPEHLYVALLRVYPTSFRREFGDHMLEVFRQMDREDRGSRVRFWWFILADICRSALSVQIDACRSGVRRFALEWTGACICGAVGVALVANGLTSCFGYWYHPYLERIALPPWSYGALLGVALGAVQSAVLHRRFHLGIVWLVASAVGTALGLEAAIAIAKIAGPLAYGVVLGCVVGSSQWAVLRTRVRQAGWWVLASTVALSVAILSCAVQMHTTLEGVNPLSHNPLAVQPDAHDAAVRFLSRGLYGPTSRADLGLEFAVMVICGLVIGALTVKPLAFLYGHQEHP
jgi:hypothetical protein